MIAAQATATMVRVYQRLERLAERGRAFFAVGLAGAGLGCRALTRAVLSPGKTSSYDGRMSVPELDEDFAADCFAFGKCFTAGVAPNAFVNGSFTTLDAKSLARRAQLASSALRTIR